MNSSGAGSASWRWGAARLSSLISALGRVLRRTRTRWQEKLQVPRRASETKSKISVFFYFLFIIEVSWIFLSHSFFVFESSLFFFFLQGI